MCVKGGLNKCKWWGIGVIFDEWEQVEQLQMVGEAVCA